MSVIFEISTFKLANISSIILGTKEKFFLVELCYLHIHYLYYI